MRNLDSNIQLPGFVCFKFQFYISIGETFSTVSATSGHCPGHAYLAAIRPLAVWNVPEFRSFYRSNDQDNYPTGIMRDVDRSISKEQISYWIKEVAIRCPPTEQAHRHTGPGQS
jgi:hypothetical protein